MRMDPGGQFKQNRVFKLPAFVFVCSGLWAETRRRLMRQPLGRILESHTSMASSKSIYFVKVRTPRPPFPSVAVFLWGREADYDSDGNASAVKDTSWTELTLDSRERQNERVDVDPVSESPLVLKVVADHQAFAAKTAYFLTVTTDGEVSASVDGPWDGPESIQEFVSGFNLYTATLRAIRYCQEELNHKEIHQPDYVRAHKHSSLHRNEIMNSEWCGCFYCLAIFRPSEIKMWIDEQDAMGQTALCPRCGIDSVIGSASKHPVVEEFLKLMQLCWFG
jgi:hypothetical protein